MSVLAGFSNITKVPELRRRVVFTMAMLAVFRIGAFVTIPGVDRNVMRAVMNKSGGGILGFFNMFSGGAMSNMSIFALGIMPYVSASIVLQLLTKLESRAGAVPDSSQRRCLEVDSAHRGRDWQGHRRRPVGA